MIAENEKKEELRGLMEKFILHTFYSRLKIMKGF